MASLDIFNNDAFSLQSRTAAIQDMPHKPGRIGALGIFDHDGVNTTQVSIEKEGMTLALVPAADRGAPGLVVEGDKRQEIPFNTLHLPQRSTIMADEIQNVRAFGSDEVQAVVEVVEKRQRKHRMQIDATYEHLMVGAIKGKLLDADGSTELLDLFQRFNLTQTTFSLVLATSTTKVREKILSLMDLIEDKLDGIPFTGVRVLCGRTYFKDFVSHDKVSPLYERYLDGAMNRDDVRGGFELAGAVFEQYRGQIGGNKFIADGEAYAVPMGVPDLFIARYAPANYMETVGTNGLPYYSKMEPLSMNKGMALESQGNPIMLCSRPTAVVKLTG